MESGFEPRNMVEVLRNARGFLLKHLKGVTEDQLDWKPYPECKSIRETLEHLVVDDLAAIDSLKSGKEPEYHEFKVEERELEALLNRLASVRKDLETILEEVLGNKGFGDEICIFGWKVSVGTGVPMLTSEDYYHAGQIAFIRLANDPQWDYYAEIYGG